jgi:hypothetical protein
VWKLLKHTRAARRVPLLKWLAAAEILMLSYRHLRRLDRAEQRQLRELVARGVTARRLDSRERRQVKVLVSRMQPRVFVGEAADVLSPLPLPERLRTGRRR